MREVLEVLPVVGALACMTLMYAVGLYVEPWPMALLAMSCLVVLWAAAQMVVNWYWRNRP